MKKKKGILNIIIIILVVIMLFFSKKENQNEFVDLVENIGISNKEFKVIGTMPMEYKAEDIYSYDEGIMVWGNKKLTRFKTDGEKEWERIFDLENPVVVFGKRNIYIYNKSVGEIYLINPKGETIERTELKAKIHNIEEGFEAFMVHTEESDIEGIKILDMKGNVIGEKMIEKNDILTYSIDDDNKTYALSSLDLTGDELKSQIEIFNLNGELLFNTFITDEIIIYSKFIDKDKLLVMSDQGLYCIYDEEVLWERKFKSISDIYISNDQINILYGDKLETISFDGNVLNSRSFGERYNGITPYRKGLILYGDEYIMGLKDRKEVFKYRGEKGILNVKEEKEKIIISYNDRIDIISK